MQGANPARANQFHEPREELPAALDVDVLQDDARVNKIEITLNPGQGVVRKNQRRTLHPSSVAVSTSFSQHRRGDVHAHDIRRKRRRKGDPITLAHAQMMCIGLSW